MKKILRHNLDLPQAVVLKKRKNVLLVLEVVEDYETQLKAANEELTQCREQNAHLDGELTAARKTGNQKSQKILLYVSAASSKPTPTLFFVLRKINSVGIHFKQIAIHEVKNKLPRGEEGNCSSRRKSRGLFRPMGIDQ
ncbi:hypothetical protein TNCV_3266771 [Trichonephila clavipes]|nr:hypothetical protein TNCV_3266771 [Trichonephila clavipes]